MRLAAVILAAFASAMGVSSAERVHAAAVKESKTRSDACSTRRHCSATRKDSWAAELVIGADGSAIG
jgi:hypothetical protein